MQEGSESGSDKSLPTEIKPESPVKIETIASEEALRGLVEATIAERVLQSLTSAAGAAESAASEDPRLVRNRPLFLEMVRESSITAAEQLRIIQEALIAGPNNQLLIDRTDAKRPVIAVNTIIQQRATQENQ